MTIDYTKTKVSDLRNELVGGGLITEQEAEQIKGKLAWIQKHKEITGEKEEIDTTMAGLSDVIEELEELGLNVDENEGEKPPEIITPTHPTYTSPEWSDYVMSLFTEKEMVNGNPNIQGLRRVVEMLLGRVVISGPIDVKTQMVDGVGKAVVTYEIQIEWKLDVEPYINIHSDELYVRVFRAVASSWNGNTDDEFAVYPEAIAETRAEGRALRKALRIDSLCAEETTRKNTAQIAQEKAIASSGDWSEKAVISDHQINTINVLCDRLGIDVQKFINIGEKQYQNLEDVSRSTAASMIKHLNRYQSTGEDALEIPNNIKIKAEGE